MGILVDTSVWIDHLRSGNKVLIQALADSLVVTHDGVISELALGILARPDSFLQSLQRIPRVIGASHREVMTLIASARLAGRGVGYLDVHLLASAMLTANTRLWTIDKRLAPSQPNWTSLSPRNRQSGSTAAP